MNLICPKCRRPIQAADVSEAEMKWLAKVLQALVFKNTGRKV